MTKKTKFLNFSGTFLIILVLFPVQQGQAIVIWTEIFDSENPTGWTFKNWQRPYMSWFTEISEIGMSVIDGVLRGPDTIAFDTAAFAYRESSVAYGNWSFDWTVVDNRSHLGYDVVAFIFTDHVNNYSMEGLTETEFLSGVTGYGLLLISSANTDAIAGAAVPGITFASYIPSFTILTTYEFPSAIVGTHHIDISRNLQGEFNIYFDSEQVINVTDNETTTSEVFNFVSFRGNSGFDNITVSDFTIEETTSTTTTELSTTTTTKPTTTITTSETSTGFFGLIVISTVVFIKIYRKKYREKTKEV